MKKITIVGIYSIIHCIVDMTCAILISSYVSQNINGINLFVAIILYNMFAFAFQLPFGILADKINKNAIFSLIGCISIIIAFALNKFGIISCVIAGIGNALFHIGGGIDVLNIAEKKATLPGIYVATGALGLYIGSQSTYLKFNNFFVVISLLIISIIALAYLYKKIKTKYFINNLEPVYGDIILDKKIITICALVTICLRGYIGLILKFEWKSNFKIGLICVLAVVLGKMLGGIMGDKFGYKKVSVISLISSAILFIFAFDNMICGILAILLFNFTMPITLIMLSNIFNNNKGLAFGLTTLALFIGAVPVFYGYTDMFLNQVFLCVSTIISAIILYIGLNKYEKMEK